MKEIVQEGFELSLGLALNKGFELCKLGTSFEGLGPALNDRL